MMGFSLGGAVALRTAIQHPEVVDRIVLVSTPFKRQGWYPEMTAGMDAIGPETAGRAAGPARVLGRRLDRSRRDPDGPDRRDRLLTQDEASDDPCQLERSQP